MGSMSIMHWLIVAGIVAMVFGTKRLAGIGKDLGSAVKEFKAGVSQIEDKTSTVEQTDTKSASKA